MGKISGATIQKTAITVTVFACIMMGQNCGRTNQFSAVDGTSLPLMKDGGRLVGDGQVDQVDQVVTTLQPSHETSGEVNDASATVGADTGSAVTTGAQETSGASVAEASTDEACMDLEKIEEHDVKKVAFRDNDGHLKNIIICHNASHNPKEHMVSDGHALKAHLGHGDYIGACGAPVIRACQRKSSAKMENKHCEREDQET